MRFLELVRGGVGGWRNWPSCPMPPRLFALDLVDYGLHAAGIFRPTKLNETIAGFLQDSQALLKITSGTKNSAKILAHVAVHPAAPA